MRVWRGIWRACHRKSGEMMNSRRSVLVRPSRVLAPRSALKRAAEDFRSYHPSLSARVVRQHPRCHQSSSGYTGRRRFPMALGALGGVKTTVVLPPAHSIASVLSSVAAGNCPFGSVLLAVRHCDRTTDIFVPSGEMRHTSDRGALVRVQSPVAKSPRRRSVHIAPRGRRWVMAPLTYFTAAYLNRRGTGRSGWRRSLRSVFLRNRYDLSAPGTDNMKNYHSGAIQLIEPRGMASIQSGYEVGKAMTRKPSAMTIVRFSMQTTLDLQLHSYRAGNSLPLR